MILAKLFNFLAWPTDTELYRLHLCIPVTDDLAFQEKYSQGGPCHDYHRFCHISYFSAQLPGNIP